ncbi:MAG: glycosyltransferase family 2 protein [Phycisphaerae bacterium]|nr:glycosyltransferase family 2 protein [Phycisphaerae bacterium]
MPLPLSVAIVCRDNVGTIGAAVDSVRDLAAEIVALDNGSTDGTIELLESRGVRVERTQWLGHIRTKQRALEACRQPWILSIDSDESVRPDLAESIRRAFAGGEPGEPALAVRRVVYYRARPLKHAWQPEWRTRLVRAGSARWAGRDPHDVLTPVDPSVRPRRLDGVLRHDSISTFIEFLHKQVQYGRISADELHAAGKRSGPFRLVVSPCGAFLKQLVVKRSFLDGWPGWLAASSACIASAAKHVALIELGRTNGRDSEP